MTAMDCFAFNWGNSSNEGSIIIDDSVIIGNTSSGAGVIGSGHLITEQRELKLFDKLAINVVANVKVKPGKRLLLTIKGDDNIVKIISSKVVNKRLIISSLKSYSTRKPLQISIEVPFLKEVTQAGTGSIFLENITKDVMKILISGNGSISAIGSTNQLDAEIDGSGTLNLQKLIAKNVNVRIDGVGEANLHVKNRLDINIQGVGNVNYSGNPKIVNKSIMGVGNIIPH